MLSLLAVLAAASALDPSLTFHYLKYPRVFRRNEVACQICYGEFDCLSMTQCGYNAAAAEVLNEDDGMNIVSDALTSKVDSLMYDLVLEDSLKEYNDCIPLISSYNTCGKDNTCLGCKTCECDETGRWNCTETHKCSSTLLHVDRLVLTTVVERLKSASRYKRSYEAFEESSTQNVFEELADIMFVPKSYERKRNTEYPKHSTTIVPTTKSVRSFNSENNNNLAFDDILSNDNLEHWIKSCEKDNNESEKHENTDSRQFLRILENIEEGIDESVHIDKPIRNLKLLKDLKKYLKENSNESAKSSNDQPNSINAIITDTADFEQSSFINSIVQKRNVKDINETTTRNETIQRNETSTLTKEIKNITYAEKELHHIVDVVNVLINNERKEINHLNYVKEYLLKFLRKYKNDSYLTGVHENRNISEDRSRKHGNWKVDMLNFYMNNLKKDVKDTLRDIYAIQKLKNLGVDPVAGSMLKLKPLLFALTSYYLNNTRNYQHNKKYSILSHQVSSIPDSSQSTKTSENQTTYSERMPQRRVFESSLNNVYKIKLIKRALTRMLVMIDKDTPSPIVLSPLKSRIKNVFNRIVTNIYKDPPVHPFIRDPNINLTTILTTLAGQWQNVPAELHKLNPADRLHNMKLLHLTLSQGIDKLKDALISTQFGYSRRMSFIEERVGKDLVSDASKYLSTIDNRITKLVFSADVTKVTPKKKKNSMWHNIKNAFSNSKDGLKKYFQNKFHKPKSYIVNDMVRRRLGEVNRQKFLEVMKRWQDNFDNYQGRQKRSVKHYTKRMKNILPKYLRQIKPNTKINPELHVNKLAARNYDIHVRSKNKLHANVNGFAGTGKDTNSNARGGTSKNKVHANVNGFAGTGKDTRRTDGNAHGGTSKNKVHANVNKFAGTGKDTDSNAHRGTTKNKVHANVNGLAGTGKDTDSNAHRGTTKNKVHANVNGFAGTGNDTRRTDGNAHSGTSENKVHASVNEFGGTSKNKVHANNTFATRRKNNVHAKGNDSTKKNGAKLEQKTGLNSTTAKRGVRTQSYHHYDFEKEYNIKVPTY